MEKGEKLLIRMQTSSLSKTTSFPRRGESTSDIITSSLTASSITKTWKGSHLNFDKTCQLISLEKLAL
jgi:hypothetical protein